MKLNLPLQLFVLFAVVLIPQSDAYAQSAVPFMVTPSLPSASYASGFKILFETGNKTYVPLNFGIGSPYGPLSSPDMVNSYLSSGSRLFATLAPAPAGVSLASSTVALGDFLGNGSVGFAYIDIYDNSPQVTVFLFDPSLVFISAVSYPVGPYPGGVIAADFNGDGKPDLAVNFGSGLGILLNRGDGTFAASATYASGSIVSGITAADINHDGKIDLVGVTYTSESNTPAGLVLLGNGDGTFVQSSFASSGASSVITGDFNGDGNLDIAGVNTNGATIYLGQGNGSFQTGSTFGFGSNPQYVAAGDFNGDGKLDLAIANTADDNVAIALGDGKGDFTIGSEYVVSDQTIALIVTDYNDDGKLDILAGLGDARAIGPNLSIPSKGIDMLLGNGDGTFQGEPTFDGGSANTAVMLTADFNADGKADVLLGGTTVSLFKGLGGGLFDQPVALPLAASVFGGATADFNGDGKPDVAFVDASGNIDVALNVNGNLLAASSLSAGAGGGGKMVTADFDGDGKSDLAIASSSYGFATPLLTIFKGLGTGAFSQFASYPLPQAADQIATADLNNDGKPDLVVSTGGFFADGSGQGEVLVFLSTSGGAFAAPVSYTFSDNPQNITIADVNGDNHPDLIVSTSDEDTGDWFIGVALGNGDGTFQAAQFIPSAFGVAGIAVQDFDGDGIADLVVAHCCGATQMSFLHGNGDGTFQPEVAFNGGPSPNFLSVTDLNGDGRPDVLVAGQSGSLTSLINLAQFVGTTVNSASFAANTPIAPDSIAALFGAHLGVAGSGITNTSVVLTDSTGSTQQATLFYVSPTQINFAVPAGLALGPATVTVTSSDGVITTGGVTLAAAAPGLYVANGLALGSILQVDAQGNQMVSSLVTAGSSGTLMTTPIALGPPASSTYLVLYGTGIRGANASGVSVNFGNTALVPAYAGAQGGFIGEDQINVLLPVSLKGTGDTTVTITAGGITSNAAHVTIQ